MTTRKKAKERLTRAVAEAEAFVEFDMDARDADVIEHVEFVTLLALNREERRAVLAAYDRRARAVVEG